MKITNYPKILRSEYLSPTEIPEGVWWDIEEKIDGSQFSFERTASGILYKSRNRDLDREQVPDLFSGAVGWLEANVQKLPLGITFRGEAISKPKHNTLTYDRVPTGNIILWDCDLEGKSLTRTALEEHAKHMGLEVVPLLARKQTGDIFPLGALCKDTFSFPFKSVLGGSAEGYVLKCRSLHDKYGKYPLVFKVVSDEFKEAHSRNPEYKAQKDQMLDLVASISTQARWDKAVFRMRDEGKLTESPKDIGPLVKSVQEDCWAEEEERIKNVLFRIFKKKYGRKVTDGLPQWYKAKLEAQ